MSEALKPTIYRIATALVAAFCIAGLAYMFYDIGASKAEYHEQAKHYAQNQRIELADNVENECSGRHATGLRECIAKAVDASREGQRREYDLEAQRGMSKWTLWLLVIGATQALATIFGLIFIKGTLDATRDAVREAGTATAAAQATANAYISVERPRLVVRAAKIQKYSDKTTISIDLAAENIGKSTGYIHHVGWKASPHNGPPHPLVLKPAGTSVHAEKTEPFWPVEAELGTRYLVGEIIYQSPFEKEHITYFSFRIDAITQSLGPTAWIISSDKGGGWPEDS